MSDREPVTIGPLHAGPGSRVTGLVPVDLGEAIVEVPVVIVHGALPGPRVSVTAGIHGAEYVSIAALREVALSLDPASVHGCLVAVLTFTMLRFMAAVRETKRQGRDSGAHETSVEAEGEDGGHEAVPSVWPPRAALSSQQPQISHWSQGSRKTSPRTTGL